MKNLLVCVWKEEDGVLSFEWTMLVTLLTFGIVSGLSGARDAVIDEMGDVAQAMLALDQSFTILYPLNAAVHTATTASGSAESAFIDAATYTDCTRITSTDFSLGQGAAINSDTDS